ncbi:DUF2062 domain-containing protein [Azoarcus olearius]|uniref:Conserved hypothetical membrane protein n=1 Tax=Azoarcus sp. (strain BH72) TaxID=418699 RepID=A1K5M3_AZOSB|nr:DUF2062 domain-containing protein [Azoarcus olearius]CAL94128.1 conserved hypothetical membrane protein [Azoarcus olearius]
MRKILKQFLPKHDTVSENRWLRPFANSLLHPRLWHLNRHSAAGAVAVGLFCGLIPGPFQMPAAALLCVLLRVNLPLALLTTLYTNPLTLVPLYILAFNLGAWVMGGEHAFAAPPELAGMGIGTWISALGDWMVALGKPLALGLVLLAAILSVAGYMGVKAGWRWWLIRHWRRRATRRRTRD